VGVDDAEGGRFVAQMRQHAAENGVLDNVGEIAGMIGVAVIHRELLRWLSAAILPDPGFHGALSAKAFLRFPNRH
jgi:hypothetical protein